MPMNDALSHNYRTSLDKVPAEAQESIKLVTDLAGRFFTKSLAMVWLFGSYARGEAINDKRVNQETGTLSEYRSDIDILVVVRGKTVEDQSSRWARLCKKVEDHPDIPFNIHLIAESLVRLNDAIANCEYFYRDVISEGVVLYSTVNQLAEPKEMTPQERRRWAIQYFERFYARSVAMRQSLYLHYQLDDYGSSMYALHQMTERLFYTYLLVFTNYKPRGHILGELRNRVAKIDKSVRDVLPQNTEEEKTNFDLLNKAYVDARYKTDYDVDIAVLDDLITRISAFQVWVYERCLVEIDKMVLLDGYSKDCAVVKDYLDLGELKKRELPQAVVVRQLGELRAAEGREKDEREEKLMEREEKEAALDKFDKEREDKEAALQEKDRLRQKLLDAGIDPDGV
ncbi:MAG: putative nucleotidyltransferase [Flavobacteriales bacterium]|jgi:predicted nucleotidyltransferase